MDLFAELKLLVATQVNMPTASGDAFTHCNVEVPLDRSTGDGDGDEDIAAAER